MVPPNDLSSKMPHKNGPAGVVRRPWASNSPRHKKGWRITQIRPSSTTATNRLQRFKRLTPECPSALNNKPPTISVALVFGEPQIRKSRRVLLDGSWRHVSYTTREGFSRQFTTAHLSGQNCSSQLMRRELQEK